METKKQNKSKLNHKTNFPIGDFLIRIKNASMANLRDVSATETKQIKSVAEALVKSRFLESVSSKDGQITVKLAIRSKKPVLTDLKIISKPGLRIYMEVDKLEKRRTPSIYIVSTSKGVLNSREAIKQRIGGEIIAEVW